MKNKLDGFLLVEAVVSLFITSLVILVLSFTTTCIKSLNKKVVSNINNDFHLATIQSDIYLGNRAKLVMTSTKKLKISDVKNSSTVFLEYYKNMIRIRGALGGHMPLLVGVNQLYFQQISSNIVKEKIEVYGVNFETYIFLDKTPIP